MPALNQALDTSSNDYQILLKTIYSQAYGETEAVQRAIAWLIKNRVDQWGGTIAGVCRAAGQFDCWEGQDDIDMEDAEVREGIERWLPTVYESPDPTQGATFYNNLDKEDWPSVEIDGKLFHRKE
ncbi:uncharacterized protein LOC129591513 [Paramacrobiotus metropolitanus]|uniref:uncharacterized protein LOC129591513 n=1 Tax=Paramacrobiotus metropolitanus TaxID=2943436 RepID=UPI00244601F4|nr:uncharacterized protein LOC129591513 [Paramacrobiotus metropolitanus]